MWLPGNQNTDHEEINVEPYMNELSNLTFSVPENELFLELDMANVRKQDKNQDLSDLSIFSNIYVINPVSDYSAESIGQFALQEAKIDGKICQNRKIVVN